MKKVAILCNTYSSAPIIRPELLNALHEQGNEVYCGRVFDGAVNEYFTEGIATYIPIIATRNNTNPFVELRSLQSVKKAIKANGIDSVIVYGVKNHAAMAIGAKLGGAKKILCVVNGSGNLFRRKGIKGFFLRCISFLMLRIAYYYSFAVAFQNTDDMALFRKKHLIKNNDKCFVTNGSGVNLSVFFHSDLPSENRFLYLSRITSSKGMTEYIKAAEIVKKQYPNVIFDIVGPIDTCVESFDDSLLRQAIDKEIVCYHGATEDVPGWMGKCRFFSFRRLHSFFASDIGFAAFAVGIIRIELVGFFRPLPQDRKFLGLGVPLADLLIHRVVIGNGFPVGSFGCHMTCVHGSQLYLSGFSYAFFICNQHELAPPNFNR